jgi:hypothetical protein
MQSLELAFMTDLPYLVERKSSVLLNEQADLDISLPELRKGIYFVRVIDRKEQFTKKMIVN